MNSVASIRKKLDEIGVFYLENEPMSTHTTFRIGGPAALYIRPHNAEALTAALAKDDDAIDYALEIFIEDQAIIDRMSGRRVCKSCGATYHVVNIPPKTEGVCDECDGELIVRDDDAPETVKKRLDVYHEQTAPLIDYYKKQGILKVIDGSKGLDTCFEEICGILEG